MVCHTIRVPYRLYLDVMAEFEDRRHPGHLLGVWGSMSLACRNPVTIVSEYPSVGKCEFPRSKRHFVGFMF